MKVPKPGKLQFPVTSFLGLFKLPTDPKQN